MNKKSITLFNTLGRKKDKFIPLTKNQVKMYCCGPTVYDYQHIGNLRTYIFEDLVKRMFQYNGFEVQHVMNITDVGHLASDADSGEDKLMKSIRKQGLEPSVESMMKIAKKYASVFFSDSQKLNIIKPNRPTPQIQIKLPMITYLSPEKTAPKPG